VTESDENSPPPPASPPTPPNPPPEYHVHLSEVQVTDGDACIANATVIQAVRDAKVQYPEDTDDPPLFTVSVHSW
jgi:hypothetical protein